MVKSLTLKINLEWFTTANFIKDYKIKGCSQGCESTCLSEMGGGEGLKYFD